MSQQQVEVRITVGDGQERIAGTLYFNGPSSTFRYTSEYVNAPDSFDLAPTLPRSLSPFVFDGLGPFSDSAPDRWGRKLLERNLKRRNLPESEYLLGVNDVTRQGVVRFFTDGTALAGDEGVPALTDLAELLNTADAVEERREIDDTALRRLYRATGSLGGARPKASVFDRNALWLAKFPKPNGDDWDVIGWEAVTLELAAQAEIDVPEHRVIKIKDVDGRQRSVLLTKRFDRGEGGSAEILRRIPYISAMTALDAKDGDGGDWLDLVEFARGCGINVHELWRRAMFGAAIGNLDDHLRNHGFLRSVKGWELSPAFDLNPEPYQNAEDDRHQLALFGDGHVDVAALMDSESLELFDVAEADADDYLKTLQSVVKQAAPRARLRQIDSRSVAVMESRFGRTLDELERLWKR
ncbi:type II toxin-antitoxin system HipA family toxin [Bifidobacterium sp. ESL0790]|uniref:type II toxin-antitoxin system HipA family toxin n=1 Tax=Bifidobacterium sp. ESL0790 TaxID=2983233 RepID=UPI0023F8D330|nr:type II toxin-antitoxin system HipA family toxin [Bifidobacterium sp. ESL0790]WEV72991.1 type II toxin-antitoxin system HipA family toxin [Bifidobacterium sp. ESL0790]